MRKHEASYVSRMKYNSNLQVKALKDELTEELDEEPIEEPVVECVPQSSLKSDTDDSEETEEDPEEECEEDPEEECEEDPEEELEEDEEVDPEEEDPEEESSAELVEESATEPSDSDSPNEDTPKEITCKLSSQRGVDGNDHQSGSKDKHSNENKRSLDATSDSDLLQVNQKKFRQEEAFKAESDVGSGVAELYGKSVVSKAIPNEESVSKQQEHTGSSGKRRRSRWDEQDEKTDEGNETSKRRKSRWASDVSDMKLLGPIQLPDFINGFVGNELDPEILKLKCRLAELNSKLLGPELHDDRPEEKRSPSPEPEYNNLGIRINTREVRLRERLVKQRRKVITKLIKKNPTFKAPPDYKPPKLFKKLYIPVKEYPTYNFIGLIIGPRGNTQKKLEQETGARILLRGKGSDKRPEKADNSDNEDLHVYIQADNQKSLDAAVEIVEKLLIPIDEGMNDHKRAQLEELAKLNGTYRNGNVCGVCKQVGHKDYACPHQQSTFKMEITCAACGSFGHPSSSCLLMASPQVGNALCGSSGIGGSSIPNTKGKPKKETNDADLYVGYLPQAVDENRLRELFCPFGKINEVKVIIDRSTGLSKGYGFVKFESSIDAAMAVTHMNGLKMEGKMLAVRVAGRPPPGGLSASSHLPMFPGPPAAISANNVLSHLSHLPMYPGPPAPVSANFPTQRALPDPPGYMLPEAPSSFAINEGVGLLSSSVSLGNHNRLPESRATDILPAVVSSHVRSQLAGSFDSSYRYPNQIPFSSPGLMSRFPGDPDYSRSQLLPYSSTPMQKPSPPPYH